MPAPSCPRSVPTLGNTDFSGARHLVPSLRVAAYARDQDAQRYDVKHLPIAKSLHRQQPQQIFVLSWLPNERGHCEADIHQSKDR